MRQPSKGLGPDHVAMLKGENDGPCASYDQSTSAEDRRRRVPAAVRASPPPPPPPPPPPIPARPRPLPREREAIPTVRTHVSG